MPLPFSSLSPNFKAEQSFNHPASYSQPKLSLSDRSSPATTSFSKAQVKLSSQTSRHYSQRSIRTQLFVYPHGYDYLPYTKTLPTSSTIKSPYTAFFQKISDAIFINLVMGRRAGVRR